MGPILLIVCSIVIATIIVLLSEKSIHRSVPDSRPPITPRYRSSRRNHQKDRNHDRFFLDEDWPEDGLFDEPLLNKKRSSKSNESNRIIATLIFVAALISFLFLLN